MKFLSVYTPLTNELALSTFDNYQDSASTWIFSFPLSRTENGEIFYRHYACELANSSTVLVDTFRYAETIFSATPLCTEDRLFWIEWLLRAHAQTEATQSSFKRITLAISLLLASLNSTILGMSRVKLAPHQVALTVAICRCLPKLSLRSSCTSMYLILFSTRHCVFQEKSSGI